jgi:hypothetical protein
MDNKSIEGIRYAEGFIEDTLEDLVGVLQRSKDPKKVEQATQIVNMWATLSNGVKALIREVYMQEQKINASRIALG